MKRASAVIVIVVLVSGLAVAEPVQWTNGEGGNNHWYEAVVCPECTWSEANALAQSMSHLGVVGYLATITSAAENSWVWAQFDSPCSYWLGGYQAEGSLEPAAGWSWVTGESWNYEYWTTQGQVEPNNALGLEHFLQFDWNCWPTWNDFPNEPADPLFVGGYIVEFGEYSTVASEDRAWGSVKSLYR